MVQVRSGKVTLVYAWERISVKIMKKQEDQLGDPLVIQVRNMMDGIKVVTMKMKRNTYILLEVESRFDSELSTENDKEERTRLGNAL